jgi:hypothetical protein
MKQIILWETQDGLQFKVKKEAEAHEASCLGLTLNEYYILKDLEKQEKQASCDLSYSRNDETLEAYNNAIKRVICFRELHNLSADGSIL